MVMIFEPAVTDLFITSLILSLIFAKGRNAHPRTVIAIIESCQELYIKTAVRDIEENNLDIKVFKLFSNPLQARSY